MENPLRPQPLMAEVLPGFTTLFILACAYYFANSEKCNALMNNKNTATVIGGGFFVLLASWIIGTLLDSLRDLIEHCLDHDRPMNWGYLLSEPIEDIQKLNDSWLAYYFLCGNMAIGLFLSAGLAVVLRLHMSRSAWIILLLVFVVYGLDFWCSRKEIRRLIGHGLPHDDVYTRLGRSKIAPAGKYAGEPDAGVGVIAIKDIRKGTLIFAPDDDKTIHFSANKVATLSPELRKLYDDFCVRKGNDYECPLSFNKLTVAWYLNDSETPNCEVDQYLRIRASKDIQSGDELFSRYCDYSE